MNFRNPLTASGFLALLGLILCANLPAQETAPAAIPTEEKARSIMEDPRLRNMLRTVKEESTEALDTLENDPDGAVREATRLFLEGKEKIDPEKLKSAVASVQSEDSLENLITSETEVKAETPALPPGESVPATRPAPGISGGVPTPLAMPVTPGEIPVEEPPAPKAETPDANVVVQNPSVDAIPGSNATTPMIPDSPGLTPESVPEPVPLTKKYEKAKEGGFDAGKVDQMEILSKEAIMDSAKGILLFTGNVLVVHPEFQIKCDKIEIVMAEGMGLDGNKDEEKGNSSDPPIKRATASGGMVEVKRTTVEDGKRKIQIAIARSLDYNAITKDITLSGGPPYIQDGDRFIKTNSEDAQIIMRGNGKYEISGTTNRSQIVIPVPQGDGSKSEEGGGLGGIGGALGGFR